MAALMSILLLFANCLNCMKCPKIVKDHHIRQRKTANPLIRGAAAQSVDKLTNYFSSEIME